MTLSSRLFQFSTSLLALALTHCATLSHTRGTGDLGVIIERATGAVQIVDTTEHKVLSEVTGLGDLSHASVVFSRDERYAYVFGRDGGLTQIDLLTSKIKKRIIQGGNSIGGAISQDGKLVAVSNYEPGGIKIFSASDLSLVADIAATAENGKASKTVGLIDVPGQKFAYSLFEGGEIWVTDATHPNQTHTTKYKAIGKEPYDAFITPEGRYYVAGLFGEDGLAQIDLWHPEQPAKRILPHYGKGKEKLPVYKMPHLEGWALSGDRAFVPAVGAHEILVIDLNTWKEVGRIAVAGQPVFAIANPDGRQVWVNFALPDNHKIQVIDTESLKVIREMTPGKAVLHLEFTPRGEEVWVSVRDENRVDVYSTRDFSLRTSFPSQSPSGIFFTVRAHRIGQ